MPPFLLPKRLRIPEDLSFEIFFSMALFEIRKISESSLMVTFGFFKISLTILSELFSELFSEL